MSRLTSKTTLSREFSDLYSSVFLPTCDIYEKMMCSIVFTHRIVTGAAEEGTVFGNVHSLFEVSKPVLDTTPLESVSSEAVERLAACDSNGIMGEKLTSF